MTFRLTAKTWHTLELQPSLRFVRLCCSLMIHSMMLQVVVEQSNSYYDYPVAVGARNKIQGRRQNTEEAIAGT